MSVALVERKLFGGTCVNTGCTPTKALVASAYAAHVAQAQRRLWSIRRRRGTGRHARHAGPGRRDRGQFAIWRRKVAARNARVHGDPRTCPIRATGPCPCRPGVADAPRSFINVGGRPLVPDMPGVGDVPYLTNSSILSLQVLPEHLVIVGGSYVGLEFGQMFRRFGASDDRRERTATRRARGRRRLRGGPRDSRRRGHCRPLQRGVHPLCAARAGRGRGRQSRPGRADRDRVRRAAPLSAAGRIPTISAWKPPA